MKKRSIIILCLLSFNLSCFAQHFFYKISVTHPGHIHNIFIEYEYGGEKHTDSLKISGHNSMFIKKIAQPVEATIYTDDAAQKRHSVFLANDVLELNGNLFTISNKENAVQKTYLQLSANDRIRPGYFPLYGKLNQTHDTIGLNKLSLIFDSLRKDDISKSYRYFKMHRNSLLSLYAFSRYSAFLSDFAANEKDFKSLPFWAKSSPDGRAIEAKIYGAKSAQVNTIAKNFTQQSSTGPMLRSSAYKGKYVLLDFWASWCGPCRKLHPYLREVYQQYKDKNFEIISVSLDDNRLSWLNAIETDRLTWANISDLKGEKNTVALQYGVQSIPANFLINPDGVIIGKNLNEKELREQLKKLN